MYAALLIGLGLTVAAPAPKDKDKPTPKLEGTWVLDKIEGKDGKDANDAPPGQLTMTFADGKVAIKEGGRRDRTEDAEFTIDATKKPAHIDIKPAKGAKDVVVRGIYEFEGEVLKICFTERGDRPTAFKADAEKRIVLLLLKRQKDEK